MLEPMAHDVFSVSIPEESVAARLRLGMWGVDDGEPHREALAVGDVALIYVRLPAGAFVGRVEIESAVREWSPQQASVYPDEARSGVLLGDVEPWDPPVLMETVVARIDPTGENPYVQENARNGFRNGVVAITELEYGAVMALRAEAVAGLASSRR